MNLFRRLSILSLLALAVGLTGCGGDHPLPYGMERPLSFNGSRRQVWAVAPAINLSGERSIDPLLQADLVYQQLQSVRGITVVPVNRVAEVYAALKIEKVQNVEQANIVCDQLGCDALLVPTITSYDPYEPPKFGAVLALFGKPRNYALPDNVDPRDLVRQASPPLNTGLAQPARDIRLNGAIAQTVGMFDSANGSIRQSVLDYAVGRNDPMGPMGAKEYFMNMDRFCGFAYHSLIADLLSKTPMR